MSKFEKSLEKVTNVQTGEHRKSFGRFHVLLRKENGARKVVMHADTREGAAEENFNKASRILI